MYAFTESLDHPFRDKMILLLHKTIPGPRGRWSEHVFPITYDKLDDVPKLLLSKAPDTLMSGITRDWQQQRPAEGGMEAQPEPHLGKQQRQKTVDASWKAGVESNWAGMDRPDLHDEQEFDSGRVRAATVIQDAYRAYRRHFEQKRISAARRIQVAYRHHLKRRNVVRKGINESQARYWRALRMRSREMEWSKDSRYYLLFRVPLGDILVCLDTIGAFFQSEKKEANKRMIEAQNKHHGEFLKAVNKYRYDKRD